MLINYENFTNSSSYCAWHSSVPTCFEYYDFRLIARLDRDGEVKSGINNTDLLVPIIFLQIMLPKP